MHGMVSCNIVACHQKSPKLLAGSGAHWDVLSPLFVCYNQIPAMFACLHPVLYVGASPIGFSVPPRA